MKWFCKSQIEAEKLAKKYLRLEKMRQDGQPFSIFEDLEFNQTAHKLASFVTMKTFFPEDADDFIPVEKES